MSYPLTEFISHQIFALEFGVCRKLSSISLDLIYFRRITEFYNLDFSIK